MKKLTDVEILAQIPTAGDWGSADCRRGLRATAVRYDQPKRRLVLDLSSGYQLGVPLAALSAVAANSERDFAGAVLSLEGGALQPPGVDVDLCVAGVVLVFASAVRGEAGE